MGERFDEKSVTRDCDEEDDDDENDLIGHALFFGCIAMTQLKIPDGF